MHVGQYAYVLSLPMCDSGLLTTILIDGATRDAGGPHAGRTTSVDATRPRSTRTAPRRVYPAGRSAARTGYRVPATAGLLGARRTPPPPLRGAPGSSYTGVAVPCRCPPRSEFRVAVGHAVVFSGVFKSARWRDDNATPRRTATWRDDKAAPRTAARSGPRGLTSNYAVGVACGPLPCVCMTSLLLRSVHRRVGLFTGGWVRPAAPGGSKTMLWEERHMGEAPTGSRRCGGQSLCEFTLVRLELCSSRA